MEDDGKALLKKRIGEKIKAMRVQKSVSRQQVADALEISLANYGYIERGEIDMPVTRLVDIANVLDASVDDLLGLTEKNVFNFNGTQKNNGHYNYQVNSSSAEINEILLKHDLEKSQLLLQERENEIKNLKKQIEQLEEINRLLKGESP